MNAPSKKSTSDPIESGQKGFSFSEVWQLLRITGREWWNDDTFRYASSLAFYTIFSLAPVLLIAVGVASIFFTQNTAAEKIVREVESMVGSEGANAVREVISASMRLGSNTWAIVVGVCTLLVGSTAVFGELQSALNRLWDVEPDVKRGLVIKLIADRARSFTLALAVGFLLLVSLVASATISGLQDYLNDLLPSVPWLWQGANVFTSLLIATLLFAMIYRFLPDVRLQWKDVLVGALVTAALFTVGKHLIGLYLGRTAIGSAFGAAGSFVVLLFWVYYSALICLFGAEFTQVYARRHGAGIRPLPHARRVGQKPDQT